MSDSTPSVHLVDIHGFDVPVAEKNGVPHDPTDASQWPAWTDNFFWEVSDPDEVAALEAAELERCQDIVDGPSPDESRWLTLMWSGSPAPESGRQVSDDELSQLAAHGCV
jgi:hypothetical protein